MPPLWRRSPPRPLLSLPPLPAPAPSRPPYSSWYRSVATSPTPPRSCRRFLLRTGARAVGTAAAAVSLPWILLPPFLCRRRIEGDRPVCATTASSPPWSLGGGHVEALMRDSFCSKCANCVSAKSANG